MDKKLPNIYWCLIPNSKHYMGNNTGDNSTVRESETPQYTCELPDFAISRYPITNGQFKLFVEDEGYSTEDYWSDTGKAWLQSQKDRRRATAESIVKDEETKKRLNFPCDFVTWYESMAFCRWFTETSGYEVSLPTEEQWEKSARGNDTRIWPWSNDPDSNRCNVLESNLHQLCAVGTYVTGTLDGCSIFGVADMIGQCYEWCITLWHIDYHPRNRPDESNHIDNRFEDFRYHRILRGGNYLTALSDATCSSRTAADPRETAGFRIVTMNTKILKGLNAVFPK